MDLPLAAYRPRCRAGGIAVEFMRPCPIPDDRIAEVLAAAKVVFWQGNAAGADPARLRLLQVIGDALRRGQWPGMASLARDAGLALRTCWRRYSDLQDAGWIEKLRRFTYEAGASHRRQETNAVRIKLPVEGREWPDEIAARDEGFIPQWPPPRPGALGDPEPRPEPSDELVDPYLCQGGAAVEDSLNLNLRLLSSVDNGDCGDISPSEEHQAIDNQRAIKQFLTIVADYERYEREEKDARERIAYGDRDDPFDEDYQSLDQP